MNDSVQFFSLGRHGWEPQNRKIIVVIGYLKRMQDLTNGISVCVHVCVHKRKLARKDVEV